MTEAHNGTDGLAIGSQVVGESSIGRITTQYLVDLLAMVGGLRCVILSMITLLVQTLTPLIPFVFHTNVDILLSFIRARSWLLLSRPPNDGALVRQRREDSTTRKNGW